jgi:hypothetical protein
MYRPQNEANMPKLRPLVDVREEVINAAMTWQQRKDFGPTVVSEIELHDLVMTHSVREESEFLSIFTSNSASTHLSILSSSLSTLPRSILLIGRLSN